MALNCRCSLYSATTMNSGFDEEPELFIFRIIGSSYYRYDSNCLRKSLSYSFENESPEKKLLLILFSEILWSNHSVIKAGANPRVLISPSPKAIIFGYAFRYFSPDAILFCLEYK